jgi:ubiquinone/menaquinone biosynthesis C-methylase UbiE
MLQPGWDRAHHPGVTEDTAAVTARVSRLFDALAPTYDSSGVEFFGPMARRLVQLLDPRPGERALDIGCGRGAASLPLAEAVGPHGAVTAADLAPAMVEAVSDDALQLGVRNLSTIVMDAAAPAVPRETYDIVAAAAVLFFLPDPREALSRWLRLLKPGGRIGFTTFGDQDPTWAAVDSLFAPYGPAGSLGPRSSGRRGPFGSAESITALLIECGAADARTVTEPVELAMADAEQWRAFTLTTGQREAWLRVPEHERERLFGRARFLLESARTDDGHIVLTQQVRYTLGRRPG